MKTLVIGLGNPILGDDGVGWRIAEELQSTNSFPPGVDVIYMSIGGISLMEALEGYERAIIIDAIVTHKAPIGTISCFQLEEMTDRFISHLSSAHDTSLQNALRIGRDAGVRLPDEITVVAIECVQVYDFSESLSPPVSASIPGAVRLVRELLSATNTTSLDKNHSTNE